MLGRTTATILTSSILAASVLSLVTVLAARRKKGKEKSSPKPLDTYTNKSLDKYLTDGVTDKTLSHELAQAICSVIYNCDDDIRQKAISAIHRASSYCGNNKVIRESGCLDALLSLLILPEGAETGRGNLDVLQILTNLACDQNNLPAIASYFDVIFSTASTKIYNDHSCAALQLLGNVALTPSGCKLFKGKLDSLCAMLELRDVHLMRNVLTVLVNLSCDVYSCEQLLLMETPENFLNSVSFALSQAVPQLIHTKITLFLINLFNMMNNQNRVFVNESCSQNLATFFKENRLFLKSTVTPLLLLSECDETKTHLKKLEKLL